MARPDETTRSAELVLRELESRGLLLEADPRLPSVATCVAGEPIRGSWWGHASGNLIYWVLDELEKSGAERIKLIRGKLTWAHPRLWPSVVALGAAREDWQLRGLSAPANALLDRTRRDGCLRLDRLEDWTFPVKPGDAARQLESRLLVYTSDVHTESGRHAKQLEDWSRARQRLGLAALPDPSEARHALEQAASYTGARLPWQ